MHTKPSAIYWNGLTVFDMLPEAAMSREGVFARILEASKAAKAERKLGAQENSGEADADVLHSGTFAFHGFCPSAYPFEDTAIEWTHDEATCLYRNITMAKGCHGSLLEWLLERSCCPNALDDMDCTALPLHLATTLKQALAFRNFISGAHLLYNVIFSQDTDEAMQTAFDSWHGSPDAAIDLSPSCTLASVDPQTKAFCFAFRQAAIAQALAGAHRLIVDRERALKSSRAKLCKPSEYRYAPAHPIAAQKLGYRYPQASTIIMDILTGMSFFRPAEARESYGALLTPPAGHTLTFALGMTYSLDLSALLAVPLSLRLMDAALDVDRVHPMAVPDGLRCCHDKLAIFCNRGSMLLPRSIHPVLPLLEHCVFEVTRGTDGGVFHPKVWVLLFAQEARQCVRVVVTSRNLTFDESLDVVVSMDGEVGARTRKRNEPLAQLVESLASTPGVDRDKRRKLGVLAKAVRGVTHFDLLPPFEA